MAKYHETHLTINYQWCDGHTSVTGIPSLSTSSLRAADFDVGVSDTNALFTTPEESKSTTKNAFTQGI